MKRISFLFVVLAFGICGRAIADDCLTVANVEKPGPNFAVFLEALESALGGHRHPCGDLINFEFGSKKGEFEVTIHHIPEDCLTFGVIGELKCDLYDIPKCYSVGKFTLTPKAAKKLAQKVAEKINDSVWEETDCGLDIAD